MGLAEAIQDEPNRELIGQYAADIVEYSRNIRDIVVELSSYSRTSSREYMTSVDLPRVIDDALRLVERSSAVQNVQFSTSYDESHGRLEVSARSNEIQQVFVNLIRNAAEAVQERYPSGGGQVQIEAGCGDGFVWARVRDNGVEAGAMRGGGCFCYLARPGDHHVQAEAERRHFDAWALVHPGKTYALSLEVESSFQAVVLRPRWLEPDQARAAMLRCGA